MSGDYIMIDRKILEWEWYGNVNTKTVFLHCLLEAKWKDTRDQGIELKRGQFKTTLPELSEKLNLSVREVRTSINHLISTGELTVKTTNKYRIITVNNYELYQCSDRQSDRQATGKRQASDRQATDKAEEEERSKEEVDIKKREERKNIYIYKESNDSLCQTQVRQVVEAWNSLGISKIKKLNSTTQRYKMLTARINEYGIDDVLAAVEKVRESDFLKGGGNKGWVIDFGWFVRPNNFPAILEGKYDNRNIKDNSEEQKGWQSW